MPIHLYTNIIFFGFALIRDFLVSHICINAALILLDSFLNTFQMRYIDRMKSVSYVADLPCFIYNDCTRCLSFSFSVCVLNSWSFLPNAYLDNFCQYFVGCAVFRAQDHAMPCHTSVETPHTHTHTHVRYTEPYLNSVCLCMDSPSSLNLLIGR